MKNGRFETQAEIYQALLDDKKIRKACWGGERCISLVGGNLVDEDKVGVTYPFLNPKSWQLYQEPREIIELYEYTENLYDIHLCDVEGRVFEVYSRTMGEPCEEVKKNILTPDKPKCRIYADSFEFVRESEE